MRRYYSASVRLSQTYFQGFKHLRMRSLLHPSIFQQDVVLAQLFRDDGVRKSSGPKEKPTGLVRQTDLRGLIHDVIVLVAKAAQRLDDRSRLGQEHLLRHLLSANVVEEIVQCSLRR